MSALPSPALQLSATNLSSILGGSGQVASSSSNGGQANNNAKKDQFSSLLDIVGGVGGTNSVTPSAAGEKPSDDKKDKIKQPDGAEIDAPIARRSTAQDSKQKAEPVDKQDESNTTPKPDRSAKEYKADSAQRPSNLAKKSDPTTAPRENQSGEVSSVQNTLSQQDEQEKIAAADATDNKTPEKTTDLHDVSNLLSVIAALLASPNIQNAAPAITDEATAITATTDPTAVTGSGTGTGDVLAIFSDLQKNLSQLGQLLQQAGAGANGITPPALSDARNAELTQINTALANDLAAIKNLFAQAENNNALSADNSNKPALQAILQALGDNKAPEQLAPQQIATQIADITSTLQNDISLLKDVLQKLGAKQLPSAEIAAANNTRTEVDSYLQAPALTQATSAIEVKNLSPIGDQIVDTVGEGKHFTAEIPAVISSAATVAVASANPQTALQNSSSTTTHAQTLAAAQTIANSINSESNNSGSFSQSNQNNNGQNTNSQPQNISGFGAGTGQATINEASKANFSQLVNRQEQMGRANVAEQVVFHVKTAVATGNSKISIQLHPEDLGKVDITLDIGANGKTGVNITADNKQTLDLLQRDSRGLERALAEAGLKADSGSLSFNLRGGQEEKNNEQNQFQAAGNYRKSQPEEEITPIATVTRSYIINHQPDGLDIKI